MVLLFRGWVGVLVILRIVFERREWREMVIDVLWVEVFNFLLFRLIRFVIFTRIGVYFYRSLSRVSCIWKIIS